MYLKTEILPTAAEQRLFDFLKQFL